MPTTEHSNRGVANVRGQVIVVMAVAIATLLGVIAVGTDVAVFYFNWSLLQKAADSAALAGATFLPANPDFALSSATQYATLNGIQSGEIVSTSISSDNERIQVRFRRTVPYHFARVLGLADGEVEAKAVAGVKAVRTARGIVPIGLDVSTSLVPFQEVVLKQAQPNGQVGPGNWKPLALGAPGADVYRDNLTFGFPDEVTISDFVDTETGNIVGPTIQGITARLQSGLASDPSGSDVTHELNDPRVIELPIVDFSGVNGSSQVPVLGFAVFWVTNVGGGGDITGEFITQVTGNDTPGDAAPQFGALSPVLME